MTDAPKLSAYIVAISFGEGGPLYVNAVLSGSDAAAAARIATEFFQQEGGGTTKPLIGVSVGQLTPEFLRLALRAYEGGLDPGKPNVVSLVPGINPDGSYAQDQRAAELLKSYADAPGPAEQMRSIWTPPDPAD